MEKPITNQSRLTQLMTELDKQLRQAAAKLSEPAFAAVWDNAEDAVYDDAPLNDCGDLINDYTKERDRWLGDLTLEAIWADLKSQDS
jgi:hypothetical protein